MSSDLKKYLYEKGVATSHTTPYTPPVERYIGTIWKAVTLALKATNLLPTCWEIVLPEVLHSIQSLISTCANFTTHDVRTSIGTPLPMRLSHRGPVFLKRRIRISKYDTLLDEVELIEANLSYAHIRHKNGSQPTASLRDLVPITHSNNETLQEH